VPAQQTPTLQAATRVGVSFPRTVTMRVKIEEVDLELHTIVYSVDGRLVTVAVSGTVLNLDTIEDESMADITVNEIVSLLNLRERGGTAPTRRDTATDSEAGRFTFTVKAIDLANNTISVIDARRGTLESYEANTIAKKDALKKVRVGDVVMGLTTPLLVTAIAPAK
jgi:hypothetical protein